MQAAAGLNQAEQCLDCARYDIELAVERPIALPQLIFVSEPYIEPFKFRMLPKQFGLFAGFGTTYLMGFKDFRMSYAAAMSYVIVGGVLILTLLFFWMQRLREARAAA